MDLRTKKKKETNYIQAEEFHQVVHWEQLLHHQVREFALQLYSQALLDAPVTNQIFDSEYS